MLLILLVESQVQQFVKVMNFYQMIDYQEQ